MIRLYSYWRSSASWRVRIGLHLKAVAFEVVPIHLVRDGGEQHTAEHTARNPSEQVPVLEVDRADGVFRLTQSLAILQWLDAVYPEPRLIPAQADAAARATQLAEVVNSGIQPLQNLRLLQALRAAQVDTDAWARDVIERGLIALERFARTTAGEFLVGDSVSIADLCLVPQLYNARRFAVDLGSMPTLCRVESACQSLPAFQKAHPDQQIDAIKPAY